MCDGYSKKNTCHFIDTFIFQAAIFIYDFASGAVASSKVSQETKHAYILQNPLKKPNYLKKTTTAEPEVDRLVSDIQERSDYDGNISFVDTKPLNTGRSGDLELPEMRTQNLENFKMRQRMRNSEDDDVEEKIESKEIVNNHAVVYRVRQM